MKENIKELDFTSEYNLSKEPIRIDLLIIKESEREKVLRNEIGRIMRKHNILEYKGPGDDLSINTLYKAMGYACLYKGYSKNSENMTDIRERSNIDAVLQASVNANYELYEQVRRDSVMCEALRELMKDEIEIEIKKKVEFAETRAEARVEGRVILNMYDKGFTLEQIMLAADKSEQEIRDIIGRRKVWKN